MSQKAEKILENKEMESLFLNYMKQHYMQRDLPESIPQSASEEKTSWYLKRVWDFNHSVDSLLHALEEKYQIKNDLEAENSLMNQIIIKACDILLDKYGEDYIRKFSS